MLYTQHCDGPWSVWLWCHVYRVMLAVNENVQVETLFTMERGGGLPSATETPWDLTTTARFHAIADLPTKNKDRRITCKLHYVVYPKCFGPFGRPGTLATCDTTARTSSRHHPPPRPLLAVHGVPRWSSGPRGEGARDVRGLNNVAAVAAALFAVGQKIHPYFFMVATSFTHYRYVHRHALPTVQDQLRCVQAQRGLSRQSRHRDFFS